MANPFSDLIPNGPVQKASLEQPTELAPIPGTVIKDSDLGALLLRPQVVQNATLPTVAPTQSGVFGGWGALTDPNDRRAAAEDELATAQASAPRARDLADQTGAMGDAAQSAVTVPDPRAPNAMGQLAGRMWGAAKGLTDSYADEQKKRLEQAEKMVAGQLPHPTTALWRSSLDKLAQSVADFAVAKPVEYAGLASGLALKPLTGQDPIENPVYQFGKGIENYAKQLFPDDEARQYQFTTKVAQGLGSTAAFGGTGLVVRMLGAGEKGMMAAIALSGAAGNTPDEFEKATKAIANGTATEQDRFINFLANSALGATEAAPFMPGGIGRGSGLGALARRSGSQAIEEGTQEFGQQIGTNVSAQQTYDPTKNPYEGVLEGTVIGGLTGAVSSGLRRGRQAESPAATDAQPTPTPEAPNQPVQRQEPELPWPAAPAQETPPVATPAPAEAVPAAPPPVNQANPFADLLPANQNTSIESAPWVAELARTVAEQKAAEPVAQPTGQPAPVASQPEPAQRPVEPVSESRFPDHPDIPEGSVVNGPDGRKVLQNGQWRQYSEPQRVVTPDGSMEIEAQPELVELDDLNLASGALQPRDRSRAEYVQGARERASRLDPMQLQPSRVSDTGAPIVMRDGTVLSGNGRTMSIAEVYRNPQLAEQAARYRASLGPQAANMRQPVLVMRAAELPAEQAAQFADLSNRGRIAQMSATERALRDSQALGAEGIALYQGGDFTAPQNRQFLADFMQRVVTTAERPSISRNGELTQEGVARMRAAVLAAAYGDADVLARMLESTDDNVRSLTGGLLDAAPKMAQLRAGIASGEVSPDMDAVPALMEAVRTISDLRSRKQPVQQWLAQTDAFGRDPVVEAWVKSFYYDQTNKAKGQQKVALLLNDYATEAMLHRPGGLFADETTPNDVLGVAQRKNDADEAADLFAPAGSVGEGIQEGGPGTAGRTTPAGRKGSRKGQQAEGAVEPSDILAAVQSAPAPIEREARELLKDAQAFDASLRKAGASPDRIAQAFNSRYGTEVTPDQVERGDVWWAVPKGEVTGYTATGVGLPEVLDSVEHAYDPDQTVAPMNVDARPTEPQRMRGTEGGASPGPVLSDDLRQEASRRATMGQRPDQIAKDLSAETGRYVRADLITQAIQQLNPKAAGKLRLPAEPRQRRRWSDQSNQFKRLFADPEFMKAVVFARGDQYWSPEMTERLGDPAIRAMTAKDAADVLMREFPGTKIVPDTLKNKRIALGYWFTGQANASPFSPAMNKRLADPDMRGLTADLVAERLRSEFGKEATSRINKTAVENRRAGDPSVAYTGKWGNKNLNAGKFAWTPDADSRLAQLMTEAPNPAARAEILNREFGGPGVPKLTPKATIKRWHKVRDAALRQQSSEPMFAIFGGPRRWLERIKGKTDADGAGTSQTGGPQSQAGRILPGQQSGTDRTRSQVNEVSVDGGRRGIGTTFRVRGLTGRILDAAPNAQGLRQAYIFLHPNKAWKPDAALDRPTLNLLQQVPNWIAKAHISETPSGGWVLKGIAVRKNKQRGGLGAELISAIEQQVGSDLSPPDTMTVALHGMWSKRSPEDLQDYRKFRGKWYSPERLRDMRDGANEYAQLLDTPIERNVAAKKFRELDELVRSLPPDVLAAVADYRALTAAQGEINAAGARRESEARDDAATKFANNKVARVNPDVVAWVLDEAAPYAGMLPPGVKVGALESIAPYKNFDTTDMVRVTFKLADGSRAYANQRWASISDVRNGYWPSVGEDGSSIGVVGFFRFDFTGYTSDIFRGELGHENVHALKRSGHLGDLVIGGLARHSDELRVMDMGLKSFMDAIGHPNSALANDSSLAKIYRKLYRGRDDYDDIIAQEKAAHLLELYVAGAVQVDPGVAATLDAILDGSIWRVPQDESSFSPPQLSLSLGEGDNDNLAAVQRGRIRDQDSLGYYSHALEAARSLKQAKGTPEQMLAQLRSAGVKQAEIEATGLDKLFKDRLVQATVQDNGAVIDPASQRRGDQTDEISTRKPLMNQITRDEIVGHLEANRVGLNEVKYGKANEFIENYVREAMEAGASEPDARAWAARAAEKQGQHETKWSSYSLDPQNPSYRETVLHLPRHGERLDARRMEIEALGRDATPAQRQEWADIMNRLRPDNRDVEGAQPFAGMPDFQQSHFKDVPNVIGHMMTSMTKHEGQPVYTIDQIQSDWGQKLRDGGVRDEAKIAELKAKIAETQPVREGLGRLIADKAKWDAYALENAEALATNQRLNAELATAEATSPGHPLVNTTDQWTVTTLRRALRQAAEADAKMMGVPDGATVEGYNPQGDSAGNAYFYEKIVAKNLLKLLTKIDHSIKPIRVDQLETPSGMKGKGFTLFPLTDKVKAEILDEGQPLFAFGGQISPSDSAIDDALAIIRRAKNS